MIAQPSSKFKPPGYNIRQMVFDTLTEMEEDGRLISVDSSPIVSPMRVVPKKDGSMRICGDYKRTLNPVLDTKQYPLPTAEECFYPMRGGVKFSKVDIRSAYNYIAIREEDSYLTTMATPQGLKKWTRLPFGVSSALAIFQEKIDTVLAGIDKCVCRVDDILITGSDDKDHKARLTLVLDTLNKAGFRCRLDKSEFLKDEVVYLGYKINRKGITPCSDKVKTIVEAKYPENRDQLIAFLGAVNYYGNFIPNMSTVIEPLNQLRGKDVKWRFDGKERKAFEELKGLIASSKVLIQYCPELPLKLDTDASKFGLGAVISHMTPDGEKPIEFASRTLTKAERNYSQIEKEALAIVWAVKKFHRYIYAREFNLVTDHKPLTFLFGEHRDIPEMGCSRLQRWAILLSSYKYKIEYRATKQHCNADMCSRFPLSTEFDEGDQALRDDVFACDVSEVTDIFTTKFVDKDLINHTVISHYSRNDPEISKVIKQVQEGFPNPGSLSQPYEVRKSELSVEHSCLLWGMRVVVPERLRQAVLQLLHATHLGVVNMKSLARSYVWWPGITNDIEGLSKNCSTCKLNQKNPPRTVIHPWIPATKPWERLHIDFCEYEKDNWLILVDAYSKWVEVVNMRKKIDSPALIRELRRIFATHGLPVCMVSDNGPSLVSQETLDFYRSNGIEHIRIPTYKPQVNGLAERMVRTFKESMKKMQMNCRDVNKNVASWLLTYRNTPHATTKKTPSEMMFGRRTRSLLTLLYPLPKVKQQVTGPQLYREFKVQDKVLAKNVLHDRWEPGTVIDREGSKFYKVLGENGETHLKHIDQLTSGIQANTGTDLNKLNSPKPLVAENNLQNGSLTPAIPQYSNMECNTPSLTSEQSSICEPANKTLPNSSMIQQPSVPVLPTTVRHSSRTSKPIERINYYKLGG